jgi:hypothetical protein
MRSLAAGFRALRHGKLILLLTLATVLIGLGAAMPLHYALSKDVGGTLAGQHFLLNHPTFAPSDFIDFGRENASVLSGVSEGSRYWVLVTVVLQMFFAGGIVVVLGRGRFTFSQFFEPARRNFWHNVKCFLLFAAMVVVVFGAVLGSAYAAEEKLFEDMPPGAPGGAVWEWGVRIVAVLLWGALSLLYDFARAARRYAPGIGAWRAYGFARRAMRGSWTRGLVLFSFWLVLGGAAWISSAALAWGMPAASPGAIAILFVLQVLSILVRAAVRVATWGSYLEFLDHRALSALPAVRAGWPMTGTAGDRPMTFGV